jgi:hypothetical protein
MTQHRSLMWLTQSLGIHLSHTQKAHFLQHLQKQQEQQMITIKVAIFKTTLPQAVASTLKCSNCFLCSLSIIPWSSSILTLASFKSSTEDSILVRGFCSGISRNYSFSYSVKQQFISTGATGNTSFWELFFTKLDKAYLVL